MDLSFHGFMGFESTSANVCHAGNRSETATVQHYAKGSVSMFGAVEAQKIQTENLGPEGWKGGSGRSRDSPGALMSVLRI
ncbi:MAG: hypothetical protein CMN16_18050 [Roseovarius sp.]|nr:hypothetical protein [Roseovarius sp.]